MEAKKKRKFNFIDVIVIVLVLFLIFAVYYKFIYQNKSKASVAMDTLEYQIQVTAVREFTKDSYHEGDIVYDGKTGTQIGTIKKIETTPAYDYLTKSNGQIALAVQPGKINVILTVQVPGVENELSYLADGNRPINVGSKQNIMTKYISQDAEIITVKNLGHQK